jgi:hypothetical protein
MLGGLKKCNPRLRLAKEQSEYNSRMLLYYRLLQRAPSASEVAGGPVVASSLSKNLAKPQVYTSPALFQELARQFASSKWRKRSSWRQGRCRKGTATRSPEDSRRQ